jgi:hypothetical protein
MLAVVKDAQMKSENNIRQPRNLLKTGIVIAQQKESTYSFSGVVEEVRC